MKKATKKQKEKAVYTKLKLLKEKSFAFSNWETLSTKLKTSEKLKFIRLCKKKNIRPSGYLRELVLKVI